MLLDVHLNLFESRFEPQLRKEVLLNGRLKKVNAGAVLISTNATVKEVPILISGVLKVLRQDDKGHEVLLYYLESGDACAMSMNCCISGQESGFKVLAEEDSEMIMIPLLVMDDWLRKFPSWRRFVFQSYNDRFLELMHSIDSMAFMKMDERLFNYLLDKKQSSGSYIITKTHQEIAEELNTSRVVVSRLLKQLEQKGLVELYRQRIEVL